MGETHLGAYAEKARVKGDWLVRLPEGMSARDAMAIGTAGFTAMLAVLALESRAAPNRAARLSSPAPPAASFGRHRSAVETRLSRHRLDRPYVGGSNDRRVSARPEVIDRSEGVVRTGQPLARERRAGGVDSVRSSTLLYRLSMTKYGGAVAACGAVPPAWICRLGRAVYFARARVLQSIRDAPMSCVRAGFAWPPSDLYRGNLLKLLQKLASTGLSRRAPGSDGEVAVGSW